MARNDDSLESAILAGVEGALVDVHTQLRGTVVAYDEATHTCTVKIGTKLAVPDGEGGFVFQTFADLPNVTVAWPSAGGFMLHWPLPAGSSVYLSFDDTDSQRWEETGNVSEPGWLERFGLSSVLAHPYSRTPIATSGAGMVCPSAFSFGNSAAAKALAVAELVSARLDAIQAKFDAHTHVYNPGPSAPAPTAPPASPIGTLAPVAATKVKSE